MNKLTAKTRKGQIIEIVPVWTDEYVEFQARYEGKVTRLSSTDFLEKDGHFCVMLNHYKIKNFFGVQIPKNQMAAIVIQESNAKEIVRKKWREENIRRVDAKIEEEIAAMKKDDQVTLYAYSGYGMHYTVESKKFGYNTGRRLSAWVQEILKMFPHEPAPEKNSDFAYKVVMSWEKFRAINADLDRKEKDEIEREKQEKQEKFDEAKATGKPVLLYRSPVCEEDLPARLREKESSLAFVSVFAMPDGTIKEQISHAH